MGSKITSLYSVLFGVFSGLLLIFAVNNLYLIWSIRKYGMRNGVPQTTYPMVSVQLPIFNEKEVVSRLIDSVLNLDWPRASLEVLILDDSDDETIGIINEKIPQKQANVRVLRRGYRSGYKAGALQYGLLETEADYIAIFDADFLPERDYLKQVIPVMEDDPQIGLVQTRWGHINQDYNRLTKAVSIALDWHHHIEQVGRNASNLFINFNGSCGVMRRKAILESGGWRADTLSEDLDISYRIQMNGWKAVYLRDVVVPGEIPPNIDDYRTQQRRWAKGSIQCSRMLLGRVLGSSLGIWQKMQSILHLNGYSVYLWTVLMILLSVPAILVEQRTDLLGSLGAIGLIGVLSQFAIFGVLCRSGHRSVLRFAGDFLFLFTLSLGLSIDCSVAVLRGLLTRGGEFLRTPKYNIVDKKRIHLPFANHGSLVLEMLFALYAGVGLMLSLLRGSWGMLVYFSLHAIGFMTVILLSKKPELF